MPICNPMKAWMVFRLQKYQIDLMVQNRLASIEAMNKLIIKNSPFNSNNNESKFTE
jgi:hypothetical protein